MAAAVLVGRSFADLLTAALCARHRRRSPASPSAGARMRRSLGGRRVRDLALLFSYALSWACACLGIVSKGPESAQGIGLIILFPLAIVSNAMVPTAHMPAGCRRSPTGTPSAP